MTQIKLARDGRHNGFPSRENRAPSWAESFVISFLQKNKIRFEREYKINRYFADFAFIDQRVILEIDGKQHLERREKDRQKDETLIKNGWNVIRIPWIHRDPIMMNEKLVNFVETYIT
jgi:very-short-patch-repair endonuclease